ncbi:MAG: hypothetical protein EXQ74_04955 [Thermoleophilia bacterium]|nr:hypothetical protein [Thermoleophilia bacterium]
MKRIAIGTVLVGLMLAILILAGGGSGLGPQVTIAGVDASGAPDQVRTAVERRAADLEQRAIALQTSDGVVASITVASIGGTVDVSEALRAAEDASPNRLVRGIRRITGRDPRTVPLPVTYRTGALTGWIANLADQIDRAEENAVVSVNLTTFTVAGARPGRMLDRTALARILTADLASMPSFITLPIRATTPQLTTEAATAQVHQADEVLRRGSTVVVAKVTTRLAPTDVASAMRFTPEGLRISGNHLRRALLVAYPTGSSVPSPARFAIRGKRVVIVPSVNGRMVDTTRVADGLLTEKRPVPSAFIDVNPVFTTAKAEQLGITEEVGSFTTAYSPGQPRVTNIRRAGAILNGTIIPPNGKLSLNAVLGRRTEDRGFVRAPMLADGLHVESVGGGVSQVATTLFNAAFFAGFALTTHTAHQFYIARYPAGREATVSWTTPDLIVTNNWAASALVRVWTGADSITIAIYSTSFDRRVETETSAPYKRTTAVERRVVTNGIAPGEEIVVTNGGEGFSVRVTRTVYSGSELLGEDAFRTVYLAPPKIIGVAAGTPGAQIPATPDD